MRAFGEMFKRLSLVGLSGDAAVKERKRYNQDTSQQAALSLPSYSICPLSQPLHHSDNPLFSFLQGGGQTERPAQEARGDH